MVRSKVMKKGSRRQGAVPQVARALAAATDTPEPPNLPGFYYDKKKHKYFKIEGRATSSQHAHTAEVVKERQAHDLAEKTEAKKAANHLAGIKRNVSLATPLSGLTCLSGEIGNRPGLDTARQILAKGLVYRGRSGGNFFVPMDSNDADPEPAFCLKPCWKSPAGEVVEVYTSNLVSRRIKFDNEGSISTLQTRLHRTTWTGGNINVKLCLWKGHPDKDQDFYKAFLTETPIEVLGPAAGIEILTSTPAPKASPFLFAYSTMDGLVSTIDKVRITEVRPATCLQSLPRIEHYLALSFLDSPTTPTNGQTLLCGSRSGAVRRIDFRENGRYSALQEPHIQHPSSITHIKHVSEHGVLISGLENQLCQYDMRFLKQWLKIPERVTFPPRPTRVRTSPILVYPDYKNKQHIRVGLDVDITSGIIAAAQESNHGLTPRVQLFSLTTGKVLRSPVVNREIFPYQNNTGTLEKNKMDELTGKFKDLGIRYESQPAPPVCVKWNEDVEGGMKSLYVSNNGNGKISRYVWGGGKDEY